MTSRKWSAQDLLSKQLLNINTGKFLEPFKFMLMDPGTRKLSALVNDAYTKSLPFEAIKRFDGDVLILESAELSTETSGSGLIGMPVVATNGTMIGDVLDFSVDEEGTVQELLLDGGLVATSCGKPSTLSMANITTVGEEALIAEINMELPDFAEADATLYQLALGNRDFANKQSGSPDDVFEQMTKRFTSSVSDFGNRVSDRVKHVDTENLMKEFTRFTVNMNKEVGRLFNGLSEQISNRKRDISQTDVDMVMQDLSGNTVRKPIHDRSGQVIIMPGQLVNEERIRQVLAADKIAELYRLATQIEEQGVGDE